MDAEKVKTTIRPTYVKNKHLVFLDGLRDSGATNMFGAQPCLMREYPKLTKNEVEEILEYWMETF